MIRRISFLLILAVSLVMAACVFSVSFFAAVLSAATAYAGPTAGTVLTWAFHEVRFVLLLPLTAVLLYAAWKRHRAKRLGPVALAVALLLCIGWRSSPQWTGHTYLHVRWYVSTVAPEAERDYAVMQAMQAMGFADSPVDQIESRATLVHLLKSYGVPWHKRRAVMRSVDAQARMSPARWQ
jgi:hypothetical protein